VNKDKNVSDRVKVTSLLLSSRGCEAATAGTGSYGQILPRTGDHGLPQGPEHH